MDKRRIIVKKKNKTKISEHSTKKIYTNSGPDDSYENVPWDPFLELTENQIDELKRAYLEKLTFS